MLHVDDDPSILEHSKIVLIDLENRLEIDHAHCVAEALSKLAVGNYDVVISDYEMPQKDGLQFLAELREQKNETPFILFTDKSREEVAIKALNLGADAYINKQGNPETVYGELKHALVKTVERKESLKLLYVSEKKYRSLLDSSLQGIAVVQGPSPKLVFSNSALGKIIGIPPEELINLSPEEIEKEIHPDDRETFSNRFRKRIQGEKVESCFEYRAIQKDGSIKWVEACANLIEYEEKPAVQIVFLDITERKNAEDALIRSEAKYRDLADSLPEIVFETDINGKLIYANQNAFEMTGYTKEDLAKGACVFDLIAEKAKEKAKEHFKRALTNQPSAIDEYSFVKKDGSSFPIMILSKPIMDGNKNVGLRGIAIDITRRKQVEEALVESEKKSRAIVANSPIGIATSGADKYFLSANEAFCKILGYTEEELRKLSFKDITHLGDLKESIIKLGKLESGVISSFVLEKRYLKKDGTIINGKIMVSSVRNENGKPTLFIAELEDTTERKKAEEHKKVLERKLKTYSEHLKWLVDLRTAQLKDANKQLVKSERLAAIGELAGMVGHDLRNPLASIKNATYFLKKKGKAISETQFKAFLEIIDKSIDHSDKIINDLLEYSKEMNLERSKYEAYTLVEEALRMVKVPDRIQRTNNVQKAIWIWVNADKMMRVFINLIKNAVDAMPQKGALEIRSCQTKDAMEISFTDTGSGIPEETLKKLFTPLFTTKAQGMGFGLAICKRIVEAHGGSIKVKTVVNVGTTFTIMLPTQIAKR